MNLGDFVSCGNIQPKSVGHSSSLVESVLVDTLEAQTITLAGTDLQTTLSSKADQVATQTSLSGKENAFTVYIGNIYNSFPSNGNLTKSNGALTYTPPVFDKTSVGLENVTNESKATMFSSPTFTGNASVGGTLTAVGNILVSTMLRYIYQTVPAFTSDSLGYTYSAPFNDALGFTYGTNSIPRGVQPAPYQDYIMASGTSYRIFTINNLPIGVYHLANIHIDLNGVKDHGAILVSMVNKNITISQSYTTYFYPDSGFGTIGWHSDYAINITKVFTQTSAGGTAEINNFRVTFSNNANRTADYYAFGYPSVDPYCELTRIA